VEFPVEGNKTAWNYFSYMADLLHPVGYRGVKAFELLPLADS
jgi:hypothetical protein